MAVFDISTLSNADEWRIFQLFRFGPINLFYKTEVLDETINYLQGKNYITHEFDCNSYKTDDAILWDVGLRLNFPYGEGWKPNLDGFNDLMRDVKVPEESGFVLAFRHFDSFHKHHPHYGQQFLEIISEQYHQRLLFGLRLTALVQVDDSLMQFAPVGALAPHWNQKEWLVKNRKP